MPDFTFTPIGDEPGQPAPGPRQVMPIDDTPVQYASGGAPMFAGEPTQAMQFGQPTVKAPLTFTPTISAQEAAAAQELRPLPGQMRELMPDAPTGVPTGIAALQALTLNPEEMRDILVSIDPRVEVNIGPEGGIYVNQPGGERFAINKPGFSMQDAINLGSTVALGLGTGIAGSAARRVALEAILQAAIEGGQKLAGGEFDIEEVGLSVVGAGSGELPGMIRRSTASTPVVRQAIQQGTEPEVAQSMGTIAESTTIPRVEVQGERMESIVRPDPARVQAAQELGLEESIPARVISSNPQYVEIERALANIPGTQLANTEKQFLDNLILKTQDFVQTYGGPNATDLPGMTDTVRLGIENTLEEMTSRSSALYDEIGALVPARTKIVGTDALDALRKDIRSSAIDVGGIKNLSPVEQSVYRELDKARTGRPMTYARLDELRKDVGEKLGTASKGIVAGDSNSYQLSRLYSALTDAQDSVIADVAGPEVSDLWTLAKSIVRERKEYEDVVLKVAGKEGNRAIIPSLANAINAMSRGNVDQFRQIIKAIPEPQRAQAISSAMVNVFGGTSAQGISAGKFGTTWRNITRNKTAREELLKYLPEGASPFLDNLATIMRAYADSNAVPRTGAINALERYNSDDGLVQRVLPYLMGGRGNMIQRAMEGGDAAANAQQRAAADMLGNPNVVRIMTRKAKGEPVTRLEDNFMQTPAFRAWTETLPADIKTRVLSIGIAEYLFEDGSRVPGLGEDN